MSAIQPATRRAGIQKKIGWHSFRHTSSTLVQSLGVDAKVVQELVRPVSFKTTMVGLRARELVVRHEGCGRIRADARKSLIVGVPLLQI